MLHQFLTSHFNEKVRWTLDYKGIEHRRKSYLPGPHVPAIKKLSGGASTTPVLQHDAGCISGSAAIIDYLERTYPEPPLYLHEPTQQAEVLAIQERFDAVVGPATRTAVFSVFINEGSYLCRTFSAGKPLARRMGYLAMFPLAKPLIRKGNGVYPENIARSLEVVQRTLDEVAVKTEATGYLVGTRFSVADLTVASLLMPLADVDHPDTRRLRPMPGAMTAFLGQFAAHPAIAWVHRIYAQHRPVITKTARADAAN